MQMYSYFWFGVVIDDFLFKGFNISTWGGMLGVCLGSTLLAFLLASITFSKEMLFHKLAAQQQGQAVAISHSQLLQVWTSPWSIHLAQTLLNMIQITLGYLLMLCVMSFNGYLLISVVIGGISGYLFMNPSLEMRRSIRDSRRLVQIQCQEDECGALISGQEQQGSIVAGSSGTSQDSDKEICVSATVHYA